MKIPVLKYFSILIAVVLTSMMELSCHNPVFPSSPVNKDLINFKGFYVSAETVGLSTFVRGTIFVKGDKEKAGARHVQIVAWTEIDTIDWGGVSFGIPQGWEVTNIASDYPQGNPGPEAYANVLHTEAELEFTSFVEIGRTKYSSNLKQGGKGNLIIELAPVSSEQKLPENLEILIGVGSKGEYTVNPVGDTIQVPLNIDYRAGKGS